MQIPLKYPLILASGSPRRKEIMESAGFQFKVEVRPTEEDFDSKMPLEEIPVFLAKQKIYEFKDIKDSLILCADTIVAIEGEVLNKPQNREDAMAMLQKLSGKKHLVITGVAIQLNESLKTFYDVTEVDFRKVSESECAFYLDHWKPYDKAGGYGIQEFMGMIGIESLNGSYYNVMGLPIHKVYEHLKRYAIWDDK